MQWPFFVLADQDGETADLIARCDDVAFVGHDEQGERTPSMTSWANLMPSTKLSFWLMRAATSSVLFTLPELMAMNCFPPAEKHSSMSCSALLMMPTVVMPKVPRCERTKGALRIGVADATDAAASVKLCRSSSNFVRNGVFSIEWISALEIRFRCRRKSCLHGVFPDGSGNRRRRTHQEPTLSVGCSSEESAHCAPFVIG